MTKKKVDVFNGHYTSKNEDPFFHDQPPLEFIEDLKSPVHEKAPLNFDTRKEKRDGEVSAKGIYIKERFPESEGLLDTAYADFEEFRKVCKIEGEGYPVIIEKGITECFEAWRMTVTEECCRIVSADTEGARRAIFYLEGELTKREGEFLPIGTVERRPYIKASIT